MTVKRPIMIVVIGGIAFLAAAWAFQFMVSKLIYKPDEVSQCKAFVINNANIQDFFGTIESIKLRVKGGGRTVSTKEGISGSCSFKITGSKQKGNIKVKWQKNNGKISVTLVSMRQGLAGTSTLWPKATSVAYILPSHVWDGIILLGMALIVFSLYLDTKRNGKWVKLFFAFATKSESSRAIMELLFLVGVIAQVIWSILCFLNISTLF